jgi:hypothetical protein
MSPHYHPYSCFWRLFEKKKRRELYARATTYLFQVRDRPAARAAKSLKYEKCELLTYYMNFLLCQQTKISTNYVEIFVCYFFFAFAFLTTVFGAGFFSVFFVESFTTDFAILTDFGTSTI